jgi:hypothetical protein
MCGFLRGIRVVFAVGVLLACPRACLAQSPADIAGVALTKLSQPVYPEIALTARVQGDVELLLNIRRDGSVESVAIISGPPLLQRAAFSSADQSQFKCLDCLEEVTPYHLIYTFQIDIPPDACNGADGQNKPMPVEQVTEVVQSKDHVTITGHPSPACIIEYAKRVRSLKCLYMWKCGIRW